MVVYCILTGLAVYYIALWIWYRHADNHTPTDKANDAPHTNLASQVTQEEQQTETVRVEKTTNRKRKGGTGDYRETYFQKVELADRQPLYVSRTTHEKLMRIVTVIGGRKVTVSSYVENILLRHFEQYQDEINTLYESHFQKPV